LSVVEERNYTVYMHVNKANDKCYIGVTKMNPKKRWGENGVNYKRQMFYRAILKYGWDKFEHIILFENKTKKEAEKLEILYIKVLMSNEDAYGYNIANGGLSIGMVSEKTKNKLSKSHIGKKFSKEHPHSELQVVYPLKSKTQCF